MFDEIMQKRSENVLRAICRIYVAYTSRIWKWVKQNMITKFTTLIIIIFHGYKKMKHQLLESSEKNYRQSSAITRRKGASHKFSSANCLILVYRSFYLKTNGQVDQICPAMVNRTLPYNNLFRSILPHQGN